MANKTIKELSEASVINLDDNNPNYFAVFVNKDNDENKDKTVKLLDKNLLAQQESIFTENTQDLEDVDLQNDINITAIINDSQGNKNISFNDIGTNIQNNFSDQLQQQAGTIIGEWFEINKDKYETSVDIDDIYTNNIIQQSDFDLNDLLTLGSYYYNNHGIIENSPWGEETAPDFKIIVQKITPNILRQTIRPLNEYSYIIRDIQFQRYYKKTQDIQIKENKKYYNYNSTGGGFDENKDYYTFSKYNYSSYVNPLLTNHFNYSTIDKKTHSLTSSQRRLSNIKIIIFIKRVTQVSNREVVGTSSAIKRITFSDLKKYNSYSYCNYLGLTRTRDNDLAYLFLMLNISRATISSEAIDYVSSISVQGYSSMSANNIPGGTRVFGAICGYEAIIGPETLLNYDNPNMMQQKVNISTSTQYSGNSPFISSYDINTEKNPGDYISSEDNLYEVYYKEIQEANEWKTIPTIN